MSNPPTINTVHPDEGRNERGWRGPSTRKLAALALLVGGGLIAAQALWIPAKAQVAQVLMNGAWEHQLATGDHARPWPWADFTPAARLQFPSLDRNVLAVTDAGGEGMAFGPIQMAAAVQPGERGVAVFAAHRDTHFAFLGELKTGDAVIVETPEGSRSFRVTGSEVVRWDRSGIVTHDGGRPRIALATCWPLDAKTPGPMRFVVWAEMEA